MIRFNDPFENADAHHTAQPPGNFPGWQPMPGDACDTESAETNSANGFMFVMSMYCCQTTSWFPSCLQASGSMRKKRTDFGRTTQAPKCWKVPHHIRRWLASRFPFVDINKVVVLWLPWQSNVLAKLRAVQVGQAFTGADLRLAGGGKKRSRDSERYRVSCLPVDVIKHDYQTST